MKTRVRGSDYRAMNSQQREVAFARLVADANSVPNGECKQIADEIAGFEARAQMDSATMLAALKGGRITETFEVCRWLMALQIRDRLASLSSRPQ
jgi:hypothetical protein